MNIEEAVLYLSNLNNQYLIIGFKPDGYRGIPATFEKFIGLAKDEDQVLSLIDKLSQFRIYKVGEEIMSTKVWIDKKKNKESADTELKERALLEKLKSKYEKK